LLLSKVSESLNLEEIEPLIKSEIISSIPENSRILPVKHLYNIYSQDIVEYIQNLTGIVIDNPK
jgi:hypothetical protein